ncbi:hypothetical protein GGI12_001909 [Dipsacomyces acuminosporus]|nr:hypothetical protein GGI12_001909 [Dipsacomyces acuminosporus]
MSWIKGGSDSHTSSAPTAPPATAPPAAAPPAAAPPATDDDSDDSAVMPRLSSSPVHVGSNALLGRSYALNSSTSNDTGSYTPTSPLAIGHVPLPLRQINNHSGNGGSSTGSSVAPQLGTMPPPSAPHRNGVKRKDSFVSAASRLADSALEKSKIDFLSCLPYEIAVVVVIYADFPAITTIAEVSRSWRRFANDNAVWRRLFLQQTEWRTPRALAAAGCRTSCTGTKQSGISTPRIGDENTLLPMRNILSAYSGSSLKPAIALQHIIAPSPTPGMLNESERGGRLMGADWRYLFRQRLELDRHWAKGIADVHTIAGHADSVYCVQYDSDKIVTGSRDRTIKVWDSKTMRCMRTLTGHDASVLCLKYDDSILVTGSSDSTIIVWDWETGLPTLRLVSHGAGVLDVAFDDEYIVSCSKDCTIKCWQRSTGKLLRTMVGHRGPVNAVQLKGDRIVSASGDSLIKMWDLKTGELIRNFAGHTRGLACVQFDGKTIVSGSSDQLIKVWNAGTGRCTQTLRGHKDLVRTLHFTGGSRVVSGSYDQSIKVFNISTGECILDLKDVHTSWVFDVQFSTSKIVSTSQDNKIIIFDFAKDLDVSDIA